MVSHTDPSPERTIVEALASILTRIELDLYYFDVDAVTPHATSPMYAPVAGALLMNPPHPQDSSAMNASYLAWKLIGASHPEYYLVYVVAASQSSIESTRQLAGSILGRGYPQLVKEVMALNPETLLEAKTASQEGCEIMVLPEEAHRAIAEAGVALAQLHALSAGAFCEGNEEGIAQRVSSLRASRFKDALMSVLLLCHESYEQRIAAYVEPSLIQSLRDIKAAYLATSPTFLFHISTTA